MEALLGSQDNWDVVKTRYEELANIDGYSNAQLNVLKAAQAKDKAALYLLYQAVDESDFEKILTAPYSPQQNGVAERKNRTILNMVRSMLKGKNIPKKFWAEAVQCAFYVQNICPHAKLGKKTPQEIWSGMKPSVSHLRVFGSVAYVQVPR
uniref:Retrovirus-related Pol polyprotein from transposon TNT 1-94 n=1 Tax=Cajanus cajan TaxID=3821 RepID=A0A151SM29_CAJCA|nr:Retrovirus-related Pol polyprotein from transposon TNT 1-94 [Cajanus cajan]